MECNESLKIPEESISQEHHGMYTKNLKNCKIIDIAMIIHYAKICVVYMVYTLFDRQHASISI